MNKLMISKPDSRSLLEQIRAIKNGAVSEAPPSGKARPTEKSPLTEFGIIGQSNHLLDVLEIPVAELEGVRERKEAVRTVEDHADLLLPRGLELPALGLGPVPADSGTLSPGHRASSGAKGLRGRAPSGPALS